MNKEDLATHFQKALDALIKFRYQFLRRISVEFKGKFPDRLRYLPHDYDDDAFSEAPVYGETIMVFHGRKISIIFNSNDDQRFSYTFFSGKGSTEYYEELIFSIWKYDAKDCSELLGGERTLPVWNVKDPGDCLCLEDLAKEAESCMIPILGNQEYKKLAKEALHYLRNGAPKWRPCEVEWQYLCYFDSIMKKIQIESDNLKYQFDNKVSKYETEQKTLPAIHDEEDDMDEEDKKNLRIDKEKYLEFQTEIANEIYRIVREQSVFEHFQNKIKVFCEKNEAFEKEYKQLEEDAEKNPVLYDFEKWHKKNNPETGQEERTPPYSWKMKTPPKGYEGYVWYGNFWGKPTTTPNLMEYLTDPLNQDCPSVVYWNQDNSTKATREEKLICSYALIVAIHDTIVTQDPIYTNKVYDGNWCKRDTWIRHLCDVESDDDCFQMVESYYALHGFKAWIQRALADVKADLARIGKTTVEQKTKAKQETKKKQNGSARYQLIAALQELHGIGTDKIKFEPLMSKELEGKLYWNQPKVHREMKKIFGDNPMQKYKRCFGAQKKLTGFMKELEDGTYEVDGIIESKQE